jgi:capsular polysaccharide biosynthesis protein
MILFYQLVLGHFVADFALQSEAMARGKNRNRKPENVPPGQQVMPVWPYWLSAHAGIHATAVYVVTHVWWLSLAELVLHASIDFMKCENKLTIHQDQALHYVCKALYALIVWRWL